MDWQVECRNCGNFTAISKSEPVLCPQCDLPDIDTEPIDGKRETSNPYCLECFLPKRMRKSNGSLVCGNRRCVGFGR